MPQSLVRNYMHLVFSTKYREPTILKEIQPELFAYLGGICRNNQTSPIAIGGYLNHVHILCRLSRKIALMDLLEDLKTHSSKWVKTQGEQYRNFYWQNGYGGFSVSPLGIDIVSKYIHSQESHHSNLDFKDEYRTLLEDHNIVYDELYVWD